MKFEQSAIAGGLRSIAESVSNTPINVCNMQFLYGLGLITGIVSKMPLVACHDQYVGRIIKEVAGETDFLRRTDLSQWRRPAGLKCLILVLESPHSKEFTFNQGKWTYVGPANGKTGENIRDLDYITEVLSDLPQFNIPMGVPRDYGLILMNAIQYQCSLGMPTHFCRDHVFMEAWNNGGRDNFIRRLKKLYQKEDIVINCCTKGKDKNLKGVLQGRELREHVEDAIASIKTIPATYRSRRTHPSRWDKLCNRIKR